MNAYVRAAEHFGFPRPTLELNQRARVRIGLASFLPVVVICTHLIDVSLDLVFDRPFAVGADVPEGWRRLQLASTEVRSFALPLSLAVLFALGIRKWSPSEGGWMFLIASVLGSASLGLGLAAVAIYATQDTFNPFDRQPQIWASLTAGAASTFAFLSIGYFFVAYRAAAITRRKPRLARRRRQT